MHLPSYQKEYLGINLHKEAQVPYSVRRWWRRPAMTDGWRDILCSWIGIVNIVRMYYPRQSKVQCSPYQITHGISHRSITKFLKVCIVTQKTPNSWIRIYLGHEQKKLLIDELTGQLAWERNSEKFLDFCLG